MIDGRPSRLEAYRKKRNPERTPEPFGGRRATMAAAMARIEARLRRAR